MALINRMSRLLTADLHAVLDRIEEPEALLRQAIREMEAAIGVGERRLKALESEREASATRRAKVEASLADLDGQLDICFGAQNDALARKLIRRKIEGERLTKHLSERLEVLDKELAARRAGLGDQREQLDVMRQRAELVTDSAQFEAGACGDDPSAALLAIGDDEVEIAFLQEQQRRKRS